MNGVALYGRYLAVSLRGQMLYPGAFLLRLVSQFGVTAIEFVAMWAMFVRFGHVGGWGFAQVAVFYAAASMAFAIADGLSRGFDMLGPLFIKTGNFDRVLLRPRSTALQITGLEFALSSAGRFAQGAGALAVALAILKPGWGFGAWLLLAWAVSGGACLFFSLKMFEAVLAFWTTEGLEVANTLTYGGEAAAQYPLDIYAAWFRKFLLYFVPIGCSLYLPIALLLGRGAPGVPDWAAVIAPASGFAFLFVALAAWGVGLRHYTSTGS